MISFTTSTKTDNSVSVTLKESMIMGFDGYIFGLYKFSEIEVAF